MGIEEFYVTFGVQYTLDPERGEAHPLGMHGNGYAVIEAPDMATAIRMANAVFEQKYAFLYDWANFMGDGTYERWYRKDYPHPLLKIKWVWP